MKKAHHVLSLTASVLAAATIASPTIASAASRPTKMPPAPVQALGGHKARAPLDVLADPTVGAVFVTNSGSNSVSIFSHVTGLPLATVTVGHAPRQIAVDESRRYLDVT